MTSSLAQVTWARSANIALMCHGRQSLSLPSERFLSTYCEPSIVPGVQHTLRQVLALKLFLVTCGHQACGHQ